MFNANQIVINAFCRRLRSGYRAMYGRQTHDYEEILDRAGRMSLEIIATSDAPYHNVEHTMLVTLVGQETLRGKHLCHGSVTSADWLHAMLSLLCHDIGYVKGVCGADRPERRLFAAGPDDALVELPAGSTDASLAPYHVDRGQQFVRERFGGHRLIDADLVCRNIERTRFPVPAGEDHRNTADYPGLVRAADLVGQLSDPSYLRKLPALFWECEETGANRALGYRTAEDLRRGFPRFYWQAVHPYIAEAVRHLRCTYRGRQILANLFAQVFVIEHEQPPEHNVEIRSGVCPRLSHYRTGQAAGSNGSGPG